MIPPPYRADPDRYDGRMPYRRCGASGLRLPAISLGLWQNFGGVDAMETGRALLLRAFDRGVVHFDLANNYGPPYGSAEANFGRWLASDLAPYRDELLLSTKAGYDMWPGPYGGPSGSRKYIVASCEQSLKRMGVDYVDIFYSHCMDPETPVEETVAALLHLHRQGKALYLGISSYTPEATARVADLMAREGVPLLIHQPRYSIFDRAIEQGLTDELRRLGAGCIAFSPLAQGLLTAKYLGDVPAEARAARGGTLSPTLLTDAMRAALAGLNRLAQARGQSLAQMALAWVLRDPVVTSALVGARSVAQLDELLDAVRATAFSAEELAEIDRVTAGCSA